MRNLVFDHENQSMGRLKENQQNNGNKNRPNRQ